MAEKGYSDAEDDDKFEDASEVVPISSEMDLATSIQETMVALNLFLNNKFSEARSKMEPWADRSMYHSLGYCTILYLQAVMTFEMTDIEAAVTAVKRAILVCNRHRKKSSTLGSLTKLGRKTNYNDYTTEELHAELNYAECLIQRALLTFVQDENLISFVKGSLKVRACYQSYKECAKILEQRQWQQDEEFVHYKSGVHMGVGLFNLLISLLPTKIMKLLEFVGFSGNKTLGLSMLEDGMKVEKALRGPLCSIILLGYHTVVTYILGTAEGDLDLADEIISPALKNYPKGALFLFFAGRIEEIKGNLEEAIVKFEESIDSQQEWRQFHHLCFWELMWCHSFQCDWLLAMKYAERLEKESRWSRATYTYDKAVFLMMCDDQTEDTQAHIQYLLGEVPKLKQRIAGKSLPIEKFVVKKVKRFKEQGNRLTLPAFEMIYVWNGFMIIGKKPKLVEPFLTVTEKTIQELVQAKETLPYFHDDYCLALLLKGVCLRYLDKHFQAEQCFMEIQEHEKKLKDDHYLVPYSMLELAVMYIEDSRLQQAKQVLQKARHNYKGYSLETRLHFRIRSANMNLKVLLGSTENSMDDDELTCNQKEGSSPDTPLNEDDLQTHL